MSNEHPRRYRVERITPGVDWSEWTMSYHRTIEQAHAATDRFFKGEGHYGYLRSRRRGDSVVRIAERHVPVMPARLVAGTRQVAAWVRRNVRYIALESISESAWNAEQAANIVARNPKLLADALHNTEELNNG